MLGVTKIFGIVIDIVKSKAFPYILIIILLAILGWGWQKNQNLIRKDKAKDQNIAALSDTLRIIETKSGAQETSIAAFVTTEKNLKELNSDLAEKLDDSEGKILTLNSAVIRLVQDAELLKKFIDESESKSDTIIQVNDSTYQAPWVLTYRYDSLNFDRFSGRTEIFLNGLTLTHNRTWLEKRETQIELTWGQRVENNQLRVFVLSKYPGFTIKSLQGVLIDPNKNPYIKSLIKKKHWFTGFSLGIGTTIGYDIIHNNTGFIIGPTFQWTIYNW